MTQGKRNRRQRSRYDRPRTYISGFIVFLGVILGVGLGLTMAWGPYRPEEGDVAPWQLNDESQRDYLIAVMVSYGHDGDLQRTIQQITELRLSDTDPIQEVANIACELASTGYVNSSGGLNAVRSMMNFYQGQGRSGCADELIPVVQALPTQVVQVNLPTATPLAPPTKTATPVGISLATETPAQFIPTELPSRDFDGFISRSFCSSEIVGVIEVRVVDFNGQGIPGQPIRVRWIGGESRFFTGLKPERGDDYADFEMEAGLSYTIEMPGLSDPLSTPLEADNCFLEGGGTSITSYEVVFRGG